MTPGDNTSPYDSCHHKDTTEGDTFGGLGTSREFREEDLQRMIVVPEDVTLQTYSTWG